MCFPGGPTRSYSYPRRSSNSAVNVAPPVAFSLPHALHAAGLLKAKSLSDFDAMSEKARKQWQCPKDPGGFWEAVAVVGVSQESVQERAEQLGTVLLGNWLSTKEGNLSRSPLRFCGDLTTTLAVLSRVNGRMFVAAEEPSYSWDTLLNGVFFLHDGRIKGVPLSDPVWSSKRAAAAKRPAKPHQANNNAGGDRRQESKHVRTTG